MKGARGAARARKTATRTGEKMVSPPPQRQEQPGQEYEREPRAESPARAYLAAGKLHDQVAPIVGGDSSHMTGQILHVNGGRIVNG